MLLRWHDHTEYLGAASLLGGVIFRRFKYHADLSKANHGPGSDRGLPGHGVPIHKRPIRRVQIYQHPDPLAELDLGVGRGDALIRHHHVVVFSAPNINDRNANGKPMAFELSLPDDEVCQNPTTR